MVTAGTRAVARVKGAEARGATRGATVAAAAAAAAEPKAASAAEGGGAASMEGGW